MPMNYSRGGGMPTTVGEWLVKLNPSGMNFEHLILHTIMREDVDVVKDDRRKMRNI